MSIFVIIDTETTGLLENPDARPIELGWLTIEDTRADGELVEVERGALLLRYGYDVFEKADEAALRVNGLDRATFEGEAKWSANIGQAALWYRYLPEGWHRSVTGWNVQFDLAMLQRAASYGEPIRQTWKDPMEVLGHHLSRERCSLARASVWAADVLGDRLSTLDVPAHRALGDCWRTFQVLRAMRARDLL